MPADAKARPDSRGMSFFDITDFSPGIYDSSNLVVGNPTTPLVSPGIFPAPPGAADGNNTYGCMAMPTGGLGPLPALVETKSLTTLGMAGPPGAVDITCVINSYQNVNDELVFGLTYVVSGDAHTAMYSVIWFTNTTHNLVGSPYDLFSTDGWQPYPFSTRVAPSNPTTTVGQPVIVLPFTVPSLASSTVRLYPSPSAPTTYALETIIAGGAGFGGLCFGHQGRIVAIEPMVIPWPAASTSGPLIAEQISYTEPPNSLDGGDQFVIFGPENPWGYGAVGSVSAGELFMVKSHGGAIIIQGDLNNPTVTTLTGVKSTGPIYGRTDSDVNGMYYCSQGHGAWLWNGGNASTKVSTQLDDEFFVVKNPIPEFYDYYCQRWGEWMLFSNNWILNSATGAWWRLSDPSAFSWFWYVPGYDDKDMFAVLPTATALSQTVAGRFDRTVPAQSYTWQSLPIRVPSEDRLSDIREIVIRASNPYGDAAPVITPTIYDSFGNSSELDTWTMQTGTNVVQIHRFNAGLKSETIAISLAVSGTDYASVVHSISIGYRPREHAALA